MKASRRYKNPPIVEAICEFKFAGADTWDDTSAKRIRALLGSDYGGKTQEQRVARIEVKSLEGEQPNLSFTDGLERVQIFSNNEERIVAVGPSLMSVHMLRPYHSPDLTESSGWVEFRERIANALEAYWEIAKPEGIVHIGMRYVNKIIIPCDQVDVEDYLLYAMQDVPGLPILVRNFFNRVERDYGDGSRLVLTQSTSDAPEDSVGFLLDLDVIWDSPNSISEKTAMDLVEDLRNREREAFEAVISDLARELFDAD